MLFGFTENKYADERSAEFERRAQDMPDLPIPGDRVILHAGLINRGHMWIRIEAICVEVGKNTARVKFDRHGDENDIWVHPAVITDNIGQTKKRSNNMKVNQAKLYNREYRTKVIRQLIDEYFDSHEELAQSTCFSVDTIKSWSSGRRVPSVATLKLLLKTYGIID